MMWARQTPVQPTCAVLQRRVVSPRMGTALGEGAAVSRSGIKAPRTQGVQERRLRGWLP